jgi:hypothetical protein
VLALLFAKPINPVEVVVQRGFKRVVEKMLDET